MKIALAVVVALLVVGIGAVLLRESRRAAATRDAASGPAEPARLDEAEVARIVALLRSELSTSQAAALQANSEQFLTLAEQRLGREAAAGEEQLKARQAAIDKGLAGINDALREVTQFVRETDKLRGDSIVQLSTVVEQSQRSVQELASVTQNLNQALTAGQQRGQWGERMAEDILRVSGLIEGVNYRRNKRVEGGTTRPDFTFLLPQGRLLHMDVKFPLAGYLRYLQAKTDPERDAACKQFLSDVRQRLKEVAGREYVDPSHHTLDYALAFIPNEQVYGFIHEQDARILDEALQMRVVLCSPLTLFAVLAVIRQSTENFHLSEQTDRILSALGGFAQQWERYQESMEKVGARLASAQQAYDHLRTTRTNQLQKQVNKVELLRREAGVEADATDPDAEQLEIPVHLLESDGR
ncbi:MAG: DNA recombination protein RmuC [Chloroflexi bacterium]|nr:DNA recombination protein RmuC [Chloroflexota bacterium]